MRISSSMMFNSGTQNMQQLQSGLYQLQNQISTGRRILTPSDDPVAAAQALVVSQNQSVNAQFKDNQGNAASQLALMDGQMTSITDLIVSVKELAVKASNGTYSDQDRATIATEVRQRYDELMGFANSSDAMGNHVFSGFRGNTQPFTATGTPGSRTVNYSGDDGRRQLQVASGRLMDVSESGRDIFMNIPQGNGDFMFTAGSAAHPVNTGTGVLGPSSMINGYDGNTYVIEFTSATTFEINGVASTQTYAAGSQIILPDPPNPANPQIQVTISGSPAVGDTFTVAPSSNQDVFKTLDDMIKALESNVSTSNVTKADFQNQMTVIRDNLDQTFNKVVAAQTSIGAREVELESLSSAAGDLDIQYSADLSKLQNLDYTKAITDLANQKMVLEAAQLSFKQVSQMSLFNFL